MLRREVTSQLRMASHILFMTVSRSGSSMAHTSGPSNMMWERTPQALYDTSMPSASLSSRLLQEEARCHLNVRWVLLMSVSVPGGYRRILTRLVGSILVHCPSNGTIAAVMRHMGFNPAVKRVHKFTPDRQIIATCDFMVPTVNNQH